MRKGGGIINSSRQWSKRSPVGRRNISAPIRAGGRRWSTPDDRARVQTALRELIGGRDELAHEYRLERPDGSIRWVRSSIRASAGKAGRRLDGVVADITDRKAAEETLRDAEARHRDLIDHAPIAIYEEDFTAVGVWMADLRNRGVVDLRAYLSDRPEEIELAIRLVRVLAVNQEAVHQAGAANAADLINAFPNLFSDQSRAGFGEETVHSLGRSSTHSSSNLEGGGWMAESADLIVRMHVPRQNGRLDLTRVIVTCTDITVRGWRKRLAIASSAVLQTVLNAIPDRISRKDKAGVYQGCNAAFARFFGLREEDVIGHTARDFFPGPEADRLAAADARLLAGGPAELLELWLDGADGRRALYESLRVPLPGPDGRPAGLIGISRDITARRQMEDQIRQAGKLEAVGQLAGGVAHDFNNLLTAIPGNLSLAQTMLPPDHPVLELLAASDQAAWRAAELTRQLLGFARRSTVRLEPADVNLAVAEALAILRRTIDPRIVIDARPASNLCPALVDLGQISQVLINLCLNARDAMPDGGTLSIETAEVQVDAAHVGRIAAARTGPFVRLRVVDSGYGIAVDVRDRIFEPFFTTKDLGRGTGLGLALVHGIVSQHRGWVEVDSTPNRGSRFDVYLPRVVKFRLGPSASKAELPATTSALGIRRITAKRSCSPMTSR